VSPAAVSAPFTVVAPQAVVIVGTAVQTTAFLRWGTLSGVPDGDWSAQTTFQLEYYELVKSLQPAAGGRARRPLQGGMGVIPAGVVTASDLYSMRKARAGEP